MFLVKLKFATRPTFSFGFRKMLLVMYVVLLGNWSLNYCSIHHHFQCHLAFLELRDICVVILPGIIIHHFSAFLLPIH